MNLHPQTATAIPPALRAALFEMDDALTLLSDAITVMEAITEGHVSNRATHPLHDQLRRLCAQRDIAFAAMRGENQS